MSDLLPIVAAALADKAAADAAEELALLRKERDMAYKVEVLRAENNGDGETEDGDVVVYASAPFESGEYGSNPKLWEVKLQSSTSCKLEDLRNCHLCVGGGFPVASLNDEQEHRASLEGGVFDINAGIGDWEQNIAPGNTVGVEICFAPHSFWLTLWIQGWPREEWEAHIQANNVAPNDIIEFLVDEVAFSHPSAIVYFKEVSFPEKSIYGAMKRLLPAKRKAKVRADRNERMANDDPTLLDMMIFVSQELRSQGHDRFQADLLLIVNFLFAVGILERGETNENDERISELVATAIGYIEEGGNESLELAIERARITNQEDEEE